jgi:hypothetical protein
MMQLVSKPKKGRKSNVEKAQGEKEATLRKMTRDGESADVHPDEVEHMKLHGWV